MSNFAKSVEQSRVATPRGKALQTEILARVGETIRTIAERRNRTVDKNKHLHLVKEIANEEQGRAQKHCESKLGRHLGNGDDSRGPSVKEPEA
jgi:hypothetical protein